MKTMIGKFFVSVMAMAVLAGCCYPQAEKIETSGCCPKVAVQDGMVHTYLGLPTADPEAYVVMLERMYPEQVNLGKSFSYDIMVTNVTPCKLVDVTVVEEMGANFRYSEASPEPTNVGNGKATWNLGELGPNESRTITVTGSAAAANNIESCATISWVRESCMDVMVINPKLALALDMPPTAGLCDTVPVTLTVSNTGVGAANNVVVNNALPSNLMTLDGQESLTFDVGTLPAGESKRYTYNAKAKRTGEIVNTATATGAGELSAKAQDKVVVRQAVLTLKKVATQKQLFGRAITCEITAANIGDAPAEDVVITDTLPSGATNVSASNGGTLSEDGTRVVWNVPPMGPKTQTTVTVSYVMHTAGDAVNNVSVNATCAKPVTGRAVTEVTGIAAILLEVIDTNDPIPVGENEVYFITATNQGSAPGTNINIVCKLDENCEYVTSSGPTAAKVDGKTITFAPVKNLPPKTKATWKVEVKYTQPNDMRFGVEMTSDQLTRPVGETEATHVY